MDHKPAKLHSLELIRAIAAIAVMIGHADYIPVSQGIRDSVVLWDGLPSLGVNLFFVLSGFVIYYVHGKDLSQPIKARNYLWRRFVRIWPLYAVLTLADAYLKPMILGGNLASVSELASSLLFLEIQVHPILGVGWTLNHEAFFYLIFVFAILFPKRLTITLLTIFVILLIARPFDQSYTNELTTWIFSSYRWHFLCGIIAACWFGNGLDSSNQKLSRRFSLVSFTAMVVICLAGFVLPLDHQLLGDRLLTPLWISCAMVLIVTLEQKFRITISKILLYIGASSYSLYLTHSTLLFVGLKLLAAKYPEWTRVNVDSIMIALCLVSIFAAAACHELLEKPLIRLLKKPHRFFCD